MYDGATATIKLNPGTSPYFSLGSAGYPTAVATGIGIWMGDDSGTYKFRVGDPSGTQLRWNGSQVDIGVLTAEHIELTGSAITIKDNTTQRFKVDGDVITIGPGAGTGNDYITMDPTNGFEIFANNTLTFRAYANGSIQIGPTGASQANVYFDVSTGRMNFRAATGTAQAYVDTDGTIKAGGGAVQLSTAGMKLYHVTVHDSRAYVRWYAAIGGVESLNIVGDILGGSTEYGGYITAPNTTGDLNEINLLCAAQPSRSSAQFTLSNAGSIAFYVGGNQKFYVGNTGNLTIPGAFTGGSSGQFVISSSGGITASNTLAVSVYNNASQSLTNGSWTTHSI